jgi:hypothetical protein
MAFAKILATTGGRRRALKPAIAVRRVNGGDRRNPRKAAVTRATMAVFEPLGRLFVELGVSSPEAESLLRSVLVHAVFRRESSGKGKRVNLSRIALLAGVHRNEVKRILSVPPRIDPGREARQHRANRILSAWHTDPDYTDAEGHPKDLDINNRRRKAESFWTLVGRYAPGVWPRLLLKELVRIGAVQELPNQQLKVCMRSYGVMGLQVGAIDELGHRAKDLLETLVHNLINPDQSRVCATALTLNVDPKWLPLLRNMLERRTRAFLSAVDEDLNSQRVQRTANSRATPRIGLTIYSFEGLTHNGRENKRPKKFQHPP